MTFLFRIVLSLSALAQCFSSEINIFKDRHPPIYDVEQNSSHCVRYCLVHVKLGSPEPKPEFWNEIEARRASILHYDRRYMDRAYCVPETIKKQEEINRFVRTKVKDTLQQYSYKKFEIYSTNCKQQTLIVPNMDTIMTYFIIGYALFCLSTTFYENFITSKKRKTKFDEWVSYFSITSNWRMLVNDKSSNPDFSRLRSIQGVRAYTITAVILCHVKLAQGALFFVNTDLIEGMWSVWAFRYIGTLDTYLVQIFFVISSWILTNQILEIRESNGEFTLKTVAILFVNRVVRYIPTLAFTILISQTSYKTFAGGPLTFEVADNWHNTCYTNWWATIFQVTNFIDLRRVCNLGNWYLSIDTQFYLVTLVIWYFVIKYKLNLKIIIPSLMACAIMVNSFVIYTNQLDTVIRLSPENVKPHKFVRETKFNLIYSSFAVNWTTSLIGIVIGYVYFNTKNDQTPKSYEKSLYFWALAVLPWTAVAITVEPMQPWKAAMIGPFLKPAFTLGIAFGLLGISKNIIRGRPKKILEWKWAVLLGNFSYSTYVFHFLVVFARGWNIYRLQELNALNFILGALIDVLLSWTIGIVGAVLIEQPGARIQKCLLPQVIKYKKSSANGCSDENKIKKL